MAERGIHPLALVGDSPQHRDHYWTSPGVAPVIDETATIGAFSSVDAGMHVATAIGARSWIMKHVHVGHDVVIGEDVIVCPMSSIGGHVQIGDGARIDMGVTIRPFVKVGKGARCGMGSVVLHDVPDGEVWAGNPAKRLPPKWDEVELLREQVRAGESVTALNRFHAFDSIKDDACPCCGGRVRVDETHNAVRLEAV